MSKFKTIVCLNAFWNISKIDYYEEYGATIIKVYWDSAYVNSRFHETDSLDVIIKKDEHIIGYLVLVRYPKSLKMSTAALTLCSKVFPKVNGEYQDILLEYVQEKIENSKSQYFESVMI